MSFLAIWILLTKRTEPTLLPMAPHSVNSEFLPLMDKYRGIVEEGVFERPGWPSFFDEAVDLILGRIVRRANSCELAGELSAESVRRLAS